MQPAAERGNLHRPREKGTAREEDRVRCLLRLRRARLLRACSRKCQRSDHRRHRCARRPCDVLLHPQRARRGRKPNRDHLGSGSPDHDSESGGARFLDPGGDDPRRPRLVRGRPRASERHHLLARPDRSVRRLSAAAGDHVSGRQGLRDRERAEPAALSDGTAQPVFAERGRPAPANALKLDLDETGWQVAIPASLQSLYTGKENVIPIDEGTQAQYYSDIVRFVSCDPDVRSLSFFHLVDERDLDRWQSGLLRLDDSKRPSFASVKNAIAQTQGKCALTPPGWSHISTVSGASVVFGYLGSSKRWNNRLWRFRV